MCGIAGHLAFESPPNADLVARMTACLAHRGPDGGAVQTDGAISLGHRRLAVIDLSDAANQPMVDATGRFQIVFNGEIYNYRELRAELSAAGARFRTASDTEVILEGYKQWGIECLRRFNGMFALALWDSVNECLLLGRDRLGKKPLFYRAGAGGDVVFASELKALCLDPTFERRLNMRALSQYLSLNYTLTSDAILEGVTKLAPGHYAICSRGAIPRQACYWDLATCFHAPSPHRNIDAASEALRALIDDAVKIRMISDVPLGVFLSGGLDSSTLAAAMCRAAAPSAVHSFSMGFKEKSYSELDEAKATAEFLGIDHLGAVTTADAAALLPTVVYHADEPFADTSIIPMYLLAEFARRKVTVCLTGDGGDEVFAGYETYVADQLHHVMQRWPRVIPATAAAMVSAIWPVSLNRVSLDYKVRQFLSGHALSAARAHYHWREIFSDAEKRELLHPDVAATVMAHDPAEEFERFDREVGDVHYLRRAAYVDLKTWLPDDILVKADRASMAHGLELRAPLLDYRIVELAAAWPIEWKIRRTAKKRVLRRSQAGRLPPAVLSRRKQGFNAPVAHWLFDSFKASFKALTLEPVGPPLFNHAYVERLWGEHMSGAADHGYKLLGLINLQLWLRRFSPGVR